MGAVDPARLVFVAECGTHTSMTRRRARAFRGSHAHGGAANRGPVTAPLTGLSLAGMSPAITVEGGTTAAVFAAYLHRVLVPALRPRQVGSGRPRRRAPAQADAPAGPGRRLRTGVPARLLAGSLPGRGHSEQDQEPGVDGRRAPGRPWTPQSAAALQAVTAADAAGWFHRAGYPSLLPT
jgi:hypothetical protein